MEINKTSALSLIKSRLKEKFYKFLTNKSMSIFLRGNDMISLPPLIEGSHESAHVSLISRYAKNGYSDFFIDIGANIGLSSCQSGHIFNRIICIEPNPLCANILRTNLSITLNENSFEVYEYALGDVDGNFELFIPKHNWGGAFVKINNRYSDEILSAKDGFESFNEDNYSIKKVEVRNSITIFKNLFSSLISGGFSKGIIKIDVEGYERTILSALAKTLPASLKLVIFFENWDPKVDINKIKKSFTSRNVDSFLFSRSIIGTNKSKLRKYFELLLYGDKTILSECIDDRVVGDIILQID